jgi:hypothetical protein
MRKTISNYKNLKIKWVYLDFLKHAKVNYPKSYLVEADK